MFGMRRITPDMDEANTQEVVAVLEAVGRAVWIDRAGSRLGADGADGGC